MEVGSRARGRVTADEVELERGIPTRSVARGNARREREVEAQPEEEDDVAIWGRDEVGDESTAPFLAWTEALLRG